MIKERVITFQEVGEDNYWEKPLTEVERERLDANTNLHLAETIDKTLLMHMAFTMEVLTKVDFPGKNESKGTVKVYRTEDKVVLNNNGIRDANHADTHVIKMGAAESGSISAPVVVFGTHVTIRDVPFHRVLGTYLTEPLLKIAKKSLSVCLKEFALDMCLRPIK